MCTYNNFTDIFLNWFKNFVPELLLAAIILFFGWWISKLISKSIKKAMKRAKVDDGITSFTYSLLLASLRIGVIISAIASLGINITSLVAAIGAAGITIGLALKDSFSNIASGVLIIINKPFKVGDYLEVDNFQGVVLKIEMMFTTFKTYDNKIIVVPNSKLTSEQIINYTAQDTRRLDLSYIVSYNEDLKKVKDILTDLVSSNEKALCEPKPIIAVSEYTEKGINIIANVWCNSNDYRTLYYEMQENVKIAFDNNKILIPFNQLDININN